MPVSSPTVGGVGWSRSKVELGIGQAVDGWTCFVRDPLHRQVARAKIKTATHRPAREGANASARDEPVRERSAW